MSSTIAWLAHAPHDVVALCAEGPRSASQLADDVSALVNALATEPAVETRSVLCRGRYAFTVAVLACWHRGETVVLPLNHGAETLRALVDGATPLTDHAGPGLHVLSPAHPRAPSHHVQRPAADRVLVRLSTSGSTGSVRLHDKTSAQLFGEVAVLRQTFGMLAGDRVVATIPAHHVYGLLFSVLLPLSSGAAFHDDAPFFPEAVRQRLVEHAATVLVSVPAHLRALAALDAGTMTSVRRVFSSGAPLHADTAQAFLDAHDLPVTEVFGSTETGGIAWRHRADGVTWTPLAGISVAQDPEGRLWLRSPFLHADDPQPRACDDRVEVHPDGRFDHHGRLDDVVKIASKRVSVSAVAAALRSLDQVDDVTVIVVERRGVPRLHALLVADPADAPTIRAALATRFDTVAVPRLHFTDALPRSAHGKIPRTDVLAAMGLTA